MNVTVNCFQGLSLNCRKFFCSWCCRCDSENDKKKEEEVLYTDASKQIVILSTPQIDFPNFLVLESVKETDIVTFCLDSEGEIRFVSMHGMKLFRTLGVDDDDDKKRSSIEGPEDVSGQKITDLLPDYMLKFLMPIYRQTLQGNLLQLTTMWLGTTQLLRTFPIFNHRRQVIAGIAITSPFVNEFNGDINRFSLCNIVSADKKKDAGPARQQILEPNHSGILEKCVE